MSMSSKEHLSPAEVAKMQQAGEDVVVVCAYDDVENHERIGIPGSVSFPDFQKKLSDLPKAEKIVFYCDCPHDELAQEKTTTFRQQGYSNASVLDGGINAWKKLAGV